MNKTRIEMLSDGVFAIAMTLLVIEIHVPVVADGAYSMVSLWKGLAHIFPSVASYVVSFTVLAMYWTSHHALFHFFTKTVNRTLLQLNMLYLMLLALIPFSTALLAAYHTNLLAVWVYGMNIVAMGAAQYGLFIYALRSKEVDLHEIPSRTITQAKIRALLTPSFALLAMIVAIVSWPLAFFLFMFPVLFNLVPGTLDATERFFGITIR
jgi:uncharacterized membrane protein